MKFTRIALEAEFLRLCRSRGPLWIESVIRPLRLPGHHVTIRDIPTVALGAAVTAFGGATFPSSQTLNHTPGKR